MKYLSVLWVLLVIGCSSCEKDTPIDDYPSCDGKGMQLVDLTGLDGCGWVLQKDSSLFEPINIDSFDIPLRHEHYYYVKFDTVNAVSICMVGPIIEIECIQPLLLEPHE